jgi:transposase InsO family protein
LLNLPIQVLRNAPISGFAGKAWLRLQSLIRKGSCWDNAVAERFFLNLKIERVWQREYANHMEAKTDITAYIVGFYNCNRIHSVLCNLSPFVFERNRTAKKPIVVSEIT